MSLKNKTVLITGAGRGIGKAIALLFANHGAKILLASRSQSELESVSHDISKINSESHVFPYDLTKDESLNNLAHHAIQQNIDILINNAGSGIKGKFHKLAVNDMDHILSINMRTPMLLTKLLLPHFLQKQSGCIINIASIAGKMGMSNSAAYCASKHGLVGFSHSIFEEVREKNIKVCVICPGFVDTRLVPQTNKVDRNKMIRPDDVASACLFVATSLQHSCPTEMILRPQHSPYHSLKK
ncbi:MAG: SDR family oxidoreductase [Deltaproteobacteria bacterium]|nr:SDR family oxidoreductase [Deltaproteobacteria bacterium]